VERDRLALSENLSAFATGDYTFDINGEERRAFEGKVGLTQKWRW
jgi:autotransporter family porin